MALVKFIFLHEGDGRWIPYEEHIAARLEEEYTDAAKVFLFLIILINVADPDQHLLAGSADLDPDPRLQNWHFINLFSVEKYCE
jgi:hypothetical protein